jgi:hypothetical protein
VTVKARWWSGGLAVGVVSMATAVGCGGETTDVSQGVTSINKDLAKQRLRLACPKSVDGGAGKVFTCTLTNTRTGKSTKMRLKVAKQNGKLAVAPVDGKEFPKAVQRVGAV